MPGLSKNATDHTVDHHVDHEVATAQEVNIHATSPVFICGVNRRLNTGNYEHVDIYAGVSLPLVGMLPEDIETLKKAVSDAAELGFGMASTETGKRYHDLKDLQKGGRPAKP